MTTSPWRYATSPADRTNSFQTYTATDFIDKPLMLIFCTREAGTKTKKRDVTIANVQGTRQIQPGANEKTREKQQMNIRMTKIVVSCFLAEVGVASSLETRQARTNSNRVADPAWLTLAALFWSAVSVWATKSRKRTEAWGAIRRPSPKTITSNERLCFSASERRRCVMGQERLAGTYASNQTKQGGRSAGNAHHESMT